ncbi:uncharacterized protein LOC112350306 [Selaginella moellendorffii]|uniref:uncharacterized protein LOC112350306 n=1 Tax=Selaginella moellendorffii TaxID=88036 RepID=UPI000D1CF548|nr:uncharacterized protein LOC112350306 [Selaginella moellendorffii]|eukprot:XP_024542028.1 uncharacterized protein LOC112350306 [Selaginella moellendorffii]
MESPSSLSTSSSAGFPLFLPLLPRPSIRRSHGQMRGHCLASTLSRSSLSVGVMEGFLSALGENVVEDVVGKTAKKSTEVVHVRLKYLGPVQGQPVVNILSKREPQVLWERLEIEVPQCS